MMTWMTDSLLPPSVLATAKKTSNQGFSEDKTQGYITFFHAQLSMKFGLFIKT